MGKAEAMASSQVRRGRIVSDLVGSKKPLSGAALAKELGVSRQIDRARYCPSARKWTRYCGNQSWLCSGAFEGAAGIYEAL